LQERRFRINNYISITSLALNFFETRSAGLCSN
jgi:hypothetical protein